MTIIRLTDDDPMYAETIDEIDPDSTNDTPPSA